MKISIISIGKKMPVWVQGGVRTYLKRFPKSVTISLLEISSGQSARLGRSERIKLESRLLLDRVQPGAWVVALDESGCQWSTKDVAKQFQLWQQKGQSIAFLIGATDGLSEQVRAEADQVWSLSAMTLPHMLVRVVLAEQLYRAWTLLNNHPYHRGEG